MQKGSIQLNQKRPTVPELLTNWNSSSTLQICLWVFIVFYDAFNTISSNAMCLLGSLQVLLVHLS